jgi:DNA polymerase-3 subunit delta'
MAAKKEVLFEFPRPIDNMELVGHDAARRAFLDAWSAREAHPIHPVWLLAGPRGIGKATLAYFLARHVFSELTGRDAARQMSQGGLGDLLVAEPEPDKKTISIEQIRSVIERLRMSSMGESWRIVIIDSLDDLSRGTANTLLKILEEPPARTLFFAIAHSLDAAIPTIRSRARVEKLRPLSPIELREIAARLLPGREIGADMARISGGSFGRIARMAADGADAAFSDALRILPDRSANAADLLALARRMADDAEILPDIAAHFGLSELYPAAVSEIGRMRALNLDPEVAVFKILTEIRKGVL